MLAASAAVEIIPLDLSSAFNIVFLSAIFYIVKFVSPN